LGWLRKNPGYKQLSASFTGIKQDQYTRLAAPLERDRLAM
jgi:hypothetical protein